MHLSQDERKLLLQILTETRDDLAEGRSEVGCTVSQIDGLERSLRTHGILREDDR